MKTLEIYKQLKVINSTGYVFDNAHGGPYKYGFPLKFSREVARAVVREEL